MPVATVLRLPIVFADRLTSPTEVAMGAFIRLYAFLSQIFDYGNTDIEKRFLFFNG